MTDKELDELADRVSRALDVPEPSPLFWEHFPGRVRAAIGATPAEAPAPWWRRRGLALALSAVMLGALSAWTWTQRSPAIDQPASFADAGISAPYGDDAADEDAGWQVVSSVAASAGVEGLREAGFGLSPGGAEAAIDDLTQAERAALMALLQAEMDGGSGGL